jgi:DNA-binding NarL/FixJ family response regulator
MLASKYRHLQKGVTAMVQEEGEEGSTRSASNPRSVPFLNLPSKSANGHALDEQEPSSEEDRRSLPKRNWMRSGNPVISIGMIDEHSFTRECITISLQVLVDGLDIASFAACEDCLRSTRHLDLILYHTHESVIRNDNNNGSLPPLDKLLQIAPVIILNAVDCPESILEAFENGARGYIPTASTTLELAIEIIRLVRAGGTFVPPSGLPPRKINRQGLTPRAITTGEFTPRQMAVLSHLKLGKANKIIASELEMSESTVKVHIRNIMKKMKATNRTEVACRAYAFTTSGTPMTSHGA